MTRGYPDFEGNKWALYLIDQFAAKTGVDKTMSASEVNQARDFGPVITYTVPAGKTLYITQLSGSARSTAAADAEKIHAIQGILFDSGTFDQYLNPGGQSGFTVALPQPIVFNAGHTLLYTVVNGSNHNVDIQITLGGYEV
jgi:hypothetical protein